ncbi:MAG TPA: cysteine hydrolase family protein [Planococcus sp. (in: firmicutes)]|nr:cysteine hydrolase family protein [Planococcus sp. (in: firmicutes)]
MKLTNTALVIVDVQKAFADPKWGERNNPDAEKNIEKLLHRWRQEGGSIVHIQHRSRDPESLFYPEKDSFGLIEALQPKDDEAVMEKTVNSAFIGTGLEDYLRGKGIEAVVIAGLTTPHCVSTTTRMSGNLGFRTYLVSDATAAFALVGPDGVRYDAETVHALTLATLHEEFAEVVTAEEMLGKEWAAVEQGENGSG